MEPASDSVSELQEVVTRKGGVQAGSVKSVGIWAAGRE